MAVSLSWSTSVKNISATQASIKVTLRAVTNSGSHNLTSSSYGHINIDGSTGSTFHHTFNKNATTTLGSRTKTVDRGNTSRSVAIYAWWHTDVSSGNISKSGHVTVQAKPSYTVTFNANYSGGSNSTKTVIHGGTTTYPSITRSGYTFNGWATSASASSGSAANTTTGTITSDTTYYATWQQLTYTISYNANGGSGAPGNQTKTHGTAITLSSTIPTRSGYTFKGWSTTANGNVEFAPGTTYAREGNQTLYAVWANEYFLPAISNFMAVRVASNSISAAESSNGGYVRISFSWTAAGDAGVYIKPTKYKLTLSNGTTVQAETSNSSNTSGTVTKVVQASLDTTLSAIATVTDVTNNKVVTSSIVLPQGGIVVHIAENQKNITLFGYADINKQGLIVKNNATINGILNSNGFSSLDGSYREIFVGDYQTRALQINSSLTTNSADDLWLTAVLKAICQDYSNQQPTIFRGILHPNSNGYFEICIYNTNDVSSGLPKYSFGTWRKWQSTFWLISTNNYQFSYVAK